MVVERRGVERARGRELAHLHAPAREQRFTLRADEHAQTDGAGWGQNMFLRTAEQDLNESRLPRYPQVYPAVLIPVAVLPPRGRLRSLFEP